MDDVCVLLIEGRHSPTKTDVFTHGGVKLTCRVLVLVGDEVGKSDFQILLTLIHLELLRNCSPSPKGYLKTHMLREEGGV